MFIVNMSNKKDCSLTTHGNLNWVQLLNVVRGDCVGSHTIYDQKVYEITHILC